MYDIIILGGGAAGLAAAAYAHSKQRDALIIAEDLGGKAGMQHMPIADDTEISLDIATVQLLARRISMRQGAVLHDRVVNVHKTQGVFHVETQHHGVQHSRVVIIASGTSPIPLDIPGAHELVNHGVGYSITTHAQALRGRPVAVIGTTARALRGAIELAHSGAQVALIAPDDTGMNTPLARTLRQLPDVVVFERYHVQALIGATQVEQIIITRDGETDVLQVDAVFADLGLRPNSSLVRRIAQVDADGFILVDEQHMTTLEGLFAAGDVTTTFAEHIMIAIGDGTRAAVSAYNYLLTQPLPSDVAVA